MVVLISSSSISEEPRNKVQIYNTQKECRSKDVHSKDDIFDLLEQLKTHQSEEEGGFLRIREVVTTSTPSVILASRIKLENSVTFCCQPSQFRILGGMQHFELGDFYVTQHITAFSFKKIAPRNHLCF